MEGAPIAIRRDFHLLEAGRGLGDFAAVWLLLGGAKATRLDPLKLSDGDGAAQQSGAGDQVLAASVGPDALGRKGCRVLEEAASRGAVRVVIEGPPQHPVEGMQDWLAEHEWLAVWLACRTTEFGETLCRRRWVVLACTGGWDPIAGEERLGRLRLPVASPCGPWLVAPRPRGPAGGMAQTGEVRRGPEGCSRRGRWSRRPRATFG